MARYFVIPETKQTGDREGERSEIPKQFTTKKMKSSQRKQC